MSETLKDSSQIDKDMDELERSMALLKREYDTFLSGGSKQMPLDLQRKVERIIKKYSSTGGLSYAIRFRFNSLVARFSSYVDLWNKQVRYREEGRSPSGSIAIPVEKKQRTAIPNGPGNHLEELFTEYLNRRQETGEGSPKLNFKSFCELLTKQREAILQKYQCRDVDFYVRVEDGHARVKARPVK